MLKVYFWCIIFFCGFSVFAQDPISIKGEIYVKIKTIHIPKIKTTLINGKESLELPAVKAILKNKNKLQAIKLTKVKDSRSGVERIFRLKIDTTENLSQILSYLKNTGFYEYVESKYVRNIIFTPNDPSFGSQWAMRKIKAAQAWDINPGGSQKIVAVIDNAIQTNHPDLQANMLRGFDASDNDLDPNPPDTLFSHGTHVAGIVSAVNNNGFGISAAANNKVKVLPIKATPNSGSSINIDNGFEAIVMAVDSGANIISLSWGGTGSSQAEQDIIDYARNNNVLVVAAAGNSNSEVKIYPASYHNVISVASLDSTDSRSSFSSFGSSVDISAPGRGILSTIPFNKYRNFSGTSMATPLVASCLGYIWSCFPSLTLNQLEDLIKKTSDDITAQNPTLKSKLGSGRINLLNSVSCKTLGLDQLTLNTSPSLFLCPGDSISLVCQNVPGTSYQWYRNNSLLAETSSVLITKELGSYRLKVANGQCERQLFVPEIKANPLKSLTPVVADIEKNYCSGSDTLKIVGNACTISNSYEYTYSGPEVGYDGNLISGADPSLEVNTLPGLLDSMNVSITWIKKDGGSAGTCGLPDGGFRPYNEEIGFSLKSPSGKIYTLVSTNTYTSGTSSSGVVTTVFKMNASAFASGLPISGNFKPNDSFADLFGGTGLGTWTLLPVDDSEIDPLCVSGFKIKFYTNANTAQEHFSWWSAPDGGTLLSNSNILVRNNLPVGVHQFYAQNRCDYFCASDRKTASITIKNVPHIIGFPFSSVILTNTQVLEIQSALNYQIVSNANNTYSVLGINNSSQPFNYLISNNAPSVSPVSLCEAVNYLLIGSGCSGQVLWSTGETNLGILVRNLSTASQITASCIQSLTCTPPPPSVFEFSVPFAPMYLTQNMKPNSSQDFYGSSVVSNQVISPVSTIKYSGANSVLLQPGFSVEKGNVFKAQIGTCP